MKRKVLTKCCALAAVAALSFFAGFESPVETSTPWESIGGCGAVGWLPRDGSVYQVQFGPELFGLDAYSAFLGEAYVVYQAGRLHPVRFASGRSAVPQ